jgi:hypothetical protein
MLRRRGAGLLLLAGALGCASNPSTVRHEHRVEGTITLEADNYRVRGYSPEDPRLVRVTERLEEVLGRPLVLRFNVNLMPRSEGFFEHFFEVELGKLPQVLDAWKQSHPKDFDAMTAELRHVDFDYDGALPEPVVEVGAPPERLRFVLNSWELPEKIVKSAVFRLYRRSLARRYLDLAPSAVPAAERSAYLEAVSQFGADYFYGLDPKNPANEEPSGGRSEAMLRTLELARLAGDADPVLTKALVERLLADGHYLRDCYQSKPDFVRDAKPPSRFLRAEQAWMRWALDALNTLPPEPRYALHDLMLVPKRGVGRTLLEPRAFPGFSVTRQGFALLAEWARAGYPTAAAQSEPAADPRTRLYDRVLCPTAPSSRGFRTQRARNCREAFYASALTERGAHEQLLILAATTPDATIFRELSLNVLALTSSSLDFPKPTAIAAVLELWQKLERSPARFRELTRLLAIEIDHSYDLREALYDQATRYYRARPEDRGVLLFLLARIDGYSRTEVNWKNFAATYGAPITDQELAVYFDQSHLAFEEFRNVKQGLAPGSGSPGTLIAARLRRYIEDPNVEPRTRGMIVSGLVTMVDELGDERGFAAVERELRAYVGTDPGRERTFRDLLESIERRNAARVKRP